MDTFAVWDDWAPTIAGAVTLLDHVYGPQPSALVVIGPDCHHEWSARSEWHRPGGRRKEVRATLDLFTHTVCRQCAVLWLNPFQNSHLDRTIWEVGTREATRLRSSTTTSHLDDGGQSAGPGGDRCIHQALVR